MTTSITIEVPKDANYKAQVISRSTGLKSDNTIEENFGTEFVLPGQKLLYYVWKGRSIQVSEIPLE